jgi:hypothetical protein
MRQDDFITQLQEQAKFQARLHEQRFIPTHLDFITSFIGRYSWQVLIVTSGLTALVLELL